MSNKGETLITKNTRDSIIGFYLYKIKRWWDGNLIYRVNFWVLYIALLGVDFQRNSVIKRVFDHARMTKMLQAGTQVSWPRIPVCLVERYRVYNGQKNAFWWIRQGNDVAHRQFITSRTYFLWCEIVCESITVWHRANLSGNQLFQTRFSLLIFI